MSLPLMITRQGLQGIATQVRPQMASTNPQARAWQPSPQAARSWPPTWVPHAVIALAEVPSTLGKPSPPPWPPRGWPRSLPEGCCFQKSTLPFLTTVLESPEHSLSPRACSSVITCTWLGKPQEGSLMAIPAKPTLGHHPEWTPPATRLLEAPSSFEPLSPLPPYLHRLGRLQPAEAVGYLNIKTAKHLTGTWESLTLYKLSNTLAFLTPCNYVLCTEWKINDEQPANRWINK